MINKYSYFLTPIIYNRNVILKLVKRNISNKDVQNIAAKIFQERIPKNE